MNTEKKIQEEPKKERKIEVGDVLKHSHTDSPFFNKLFIYCEEKESGQQFLVNLETGEIHNRYQKSLSLFKIVDKVEIFYE